MKFLHVGGMDNEHEVDHVYGKVNASLPNTSRYARAMLSYRALVREVSPASVISHSLIWNVSKVLFTFKPSAK